jgi:hypothetical protein
MEPDTILCVGYARLPEGTTMEVLYKVFGVGLVIDPHDGKIVRAQTTTATMLGDEFLTNMISNKNIETDINEILDEIARRYRGHGVKAILTAVKKAHNEYLNYKSEVSQGAACACRMKA